MTEKQTLTSEDISKIVDGLNPIDWVQMELLAKLPPGQRILPALNATLMIRAGLRSAFTKKFPELSAAAQPVFHVRVGRERRVWSHPGWQSTGLRPGGEHFSRSHWRWGFPVWPRKRATEAGCNS